MHLVQLIISHTPEGWLLIKDAIEQGCYDTKAAALAVASMMSEMIRLEGAECELIIHDEDGWRDEACPEAPHPAP
ncbi:MAG: hypothetical protein ABIO39_06305 [Caulobacteraceae bacterium]